MSPRATTSDEDTTTPPADGDVKPGDNLEQREPETGNDAETAPVDPCSWPAVVEYASTDDATALQSRLKASDWYRGRVDGVYGDITQQAVQQLQLAIRAAGEFVYAIDGMYSADTRAAACRAFPL